MGLYDRNFTRTSDSGVSYSSQMETAQVNFIKTTYKFFAASLLIATIGAIVGLKNLPVVMEYRFALFLVELVAFFALIFTKDRPGVNLISMMTFTFLTGVTLVPLLAFVIGKGGLGAVAQALAMSTIIFGIMSVFAIKTKRDLRNMGKILLISVLVVIVFSLLNVFLFHSPVIQLAVAGVCVVLFSLHTAYDTQNIINGEYDSPVMAAITLYLDFLNLFVSLLQILGITSKSE